MFGNKSIFKILKIGSIAAYPAAVVLNQNLNVAQKIRDVSKGWSGFNHETGEMNIQDALPGWAPYVVVNLVEVGLPKLMGILRSIKF